MRAGALSLLGLTLTACTTAAEKPPVTEVDVAVAAESPPAPQQTPIVDTAPPSERPFERPSEEPLRDLGVFDSDSEANGMSYGGTAQGVMGGVAAPPAPVAAPSGTPPRLQSSSLTCSFPKDAPPDVDSERVVALVEVDVAGVATSVLLVKDPGYGFGRQARECLKRARYTPATDANGQAVAGKTPPLTVRFVR